MLIIERIFEVTNNGSLRGIFLFVKIQLMHDF